MDLRRAIEQSDAEENEQTRRGSPEANPDGDLSEKNRRVDKNLETVDTEGKQQSRGSMVGCLTAENIQNAFLNKIVKNPEPIVESIMQESKVRASLVPEPIEEEIIQESKQEQ